MIEIIYIIGVFIAFILGIILYIKEENKEEAQLGFLAPLALMSWLTVFLVFWKLRDKLLK